MVCTITLMLELQYGDQASFPVCLCVCKLTWCSSKESDVYT